MVEEARKRLSYTRRGLQLIWKAARAWTLVWAVLLGIQGLLPAAVVYMTKRLVDSAVAVLQAGVTWDTVYVIAVPAALMAGLLLLQQILGSITAWISTAQTEFLQDHVKSLIHAKAIAVDYGLYESSAYYDRLEQANHQAASRSIALLHNMGNLLQSGITLVSIAALLIPYSLLLPLLLILSTLPALFVVVHHNRKYHDWWKRTTADRRWAQYFDIMLTRQAPAAELRLFNLGEHFMSSYRTLRTRLRADHLRLVKRQSLAKLGAGFAALAVTGATMGWMVLRTMRGTATLGDLALFYQAFSQGQGLMRTLLSNMGEIYTNTLFLEHLFDFLEQEIQITSPPAPALLPIPLRKGIDFRNVTFRYPGSERAVLDRFSLHIPAGKTIAIVGSNGAGKSTLIKLLCRFYDPEQGSVTLDGIDVKHLSVGDLRRQISVLFQFPVQYHATVAQNIALGDLAARHDVQTIEEAARAAGAHDFITARLPSGYSTLLGKWLAEGTDLSGGEWQRIALARAFLRQAQIVVLDEPTSFMDSWAENAWLERFRYMVQDRTAILITHRFTTAMKADTIYVMEEGQIVESGSHRELLLLGGRYATSWTAQMQAGDEVLT